MKTRSLTWRNFDYDNWSNRRILQTLQEADTPPDSCVQLLGHILKTKNLWLLRLQGEQSMGFDTRSQVDLKTCADLVDELGPAYAEYLSDVGYAEMQRGMKYHSRKGIPHTTSLFDVLTHILYHGATHRGEIRQQLRSAGLVPPDVGYITYAREEYVEGEGGTILSGTSED